MKTIYYLVFLLAIGSTATYGQKEQVEILMNRYRTQDNFNGSVLIAKKGKIDYQTYIGLANREDSIKYSDKVRFHIFSATKTFTAALIMQLYEQGKIQLDSSIATYYPEYKGEAAHKVTIRNLLTYSSGRDDKEMREIAEAYNSTIWPVDSFITRYCSERLVTQPGTRFAFNNGDFILLGKIIERLYGQTFQAVLQQKVLTPLGMRNTDYLHHEDVIAHLDRGYFNSGSSPVTFSRPTNYYIDNYFSAGAMYSTPTDLLLFDRALFHYKLLKKETVQVMLTPDKQLDYVGLGFLVFPKKIDQKEYLVAERQGYGYGHHTNWVHLIDEDVTLIIMSNSNTVDPNKMRWEVLSAYLKGSIGKK
ncbi:serine hydrolase domain-containing protein [Spirosoma validum]|uniref:Beta-lactamase family protein n=1 Tax=Spirosoma validum TaxID=2771355 RepID=A0A927B8K5_9BACT|nr:serine hydrolase domain-containing protein [Spirosoma validum]MBD2757470.1 beta-lactamase family protein [Spirosoma validum]